MTYEYKPGQFTLRKNKFKTPEDSKPDYKGDGADLAGQPIELALWKKKDKNGDMYLSGKIQKPQPKEAKPADDLGDEIPY